MLQLANVDLNLPRYGLLGTHYLTEILLLRLKGEAQVVDLGQQHHVCFDGYIELLVLTFELKVLLLWPEFVGTEANIEGAARC